ncbi:Glycoside hydrolase, family 28 [Corchorus olitorius]|uniref:Glycoside hydrolase, family 28 n=1 Tax=Corchorus olitorius TaxID=93759 RepID=A0A1R3J7U6_9ROSI|nr:Glycoside hydrolase, family 28 [Corchorus olitorius]
MGALVIFLIALLIGSSHLDVGEGQTTFNIVNFGAVGDGKTDDSGILGNVVAPEANAWKGSTECWLCFREVNGLFLYGSGQINGNGASWWTQGKGTKRPTALHLHACNNLKLDGLTHLNSQMNHIGVYHSNGVSISNLHIYAPGDSPNTDAIDISGSTQVFISNCFIGTGDDCIAIKGGSSNINITKITCGPGHGISIGSLGEDGANEKVEKVYVRDVVFNASKNGARIKTAPGGSGYARTISFEEITLINTRYPIEIDQHYCNGKAHTCSDKGQAVAISDVTYKGIHGTSSDEQAIYLDCSSNSEGCTRITIENVNITLSTLSANAKTLQVICNNAHGKAINTQPVVSCLLPGFKRPFI